MALPDSISGIQFASNGGRHGPFENSGNYYFVALDGTNAYELEVWKNTNPGTASWTNAATDSTLSSGNNIRSVDVVQVTTNLHILVGWGGISNNVVYYYYVFSMSTDSFTTTAETAFATGAVSLNNTDVFGCLEVRSGGDVVAFIQDAPFTYHGTDYNRVSYLKRVSGTWDSTTTAVDDGADTTNYVRPLCILGASDKVHFVYSDAHLQHKSLSSGDTLSSAEQVNDTNISYDGHLAYINDGTDNIVLVVWRNQSTNDLYYATITNDGTPAAESSVSTLNVLGSLNASVLAAANNSDTTSRIYTAFIDNTNRDIYYAEYDNASGWTSETVIESSITGIKIYGANVYTNDSSDTVLAYLYDESTNGESYNEYVLSAGGDSFAIAATLSGDLDTTSSLSVSHAIASSLGSDLDTTSSLSVSHALAASISSDLSVVSSLDNLLTISGSLSVDVDVSSSMFVNYALASDLLSDTDASSSITISHALAGVMASDFDVTSALDGNYAIASVLSSDVDVSSSLQVILAILSGLSADLDSSSSLSIAHAIASSLNTDLDLVSALTVTHSLASILNTDTDVSSALDGNHAIVASLSSDLDVTSALSVVLAIVASLQSDLDVTSALSVAHSIQSGVAVDMDTSTSLLVSHGVGSALLSDTDVSSSLSVAHAIASTLLSDVDVASALDVLNATLAIAATLSMDLDVSSDIAVSHALQAALSNDIDAQTALFVSHAVQAALDSDLDAVTALTVIATISIFHDLYFTANKDSLTFSTDKDALILSANKDSLASTADKGSLIFSANYDSLTFVGDHES